MTTPQKPFHTVYFSHGGGPLPILGDPGHLAMVEFMSALAPQLIQPEAIIVISAHWEEKQPTLLGAENPPMFYDYYGFPEAAYRIRYPAPGSPELAARTHSILAEEGIQAAINPTRGFDHGLFIPLSLMYPQADIPAIQLSLIRGLDPEQHLRLGEALRSLDDGKVLFIGSGFSFHNMQAFSWSPEAAPDPANDAFQDWLIETCAAQTDYALIRQSLQTWEKAPSARYCHPREEHLMPLLVCAGLAGKSGSVIFDDAILGKRGIALGWE